MTSITTTSPVSPRVGRGLLIGGTLVVGLAVAGSIVVPRLTTTDTTTGTTTATTITSARAGGPDALELNRQPAVGVRSGSDAQRHFFGGQSVTGATSPGLRGPHALDPRAWVRTTSYTGSAYAVGGSMYQQQVPSVLVVGTSGPTSADGAERWSSGPLVAVPKRGYR